MPTVMIFVMAFIGGINSISTPKKDDQSLISHSIGYEKASKSAVLKIFLNKYNSPLADHAETFVEVAEKYGIDYRLLPAIGCMESTCGKFLIPGSYNPFGWGIYGDNVIRFANYDEAIETVGKGIYEGYVSKGADTPSKMAPIYTPPNHVNWLNGVSYFIGQIDDIASDLGQDTA